MTQAMAAFEPFVSAGGRTQTTYDEVLAAIEAFGNPRPSTH